MVGIRGPLDFLKRLGDVPLEPLVEKLRELHEQGHADATHLQALLALPEGPSRTAVAAAVPTPVSPDYEDARRHFIEHSQRLREQALLAERLLGSLARRDTASTPAPLQRELRIECARRSTSAARFEIVNCLDHAVDVRFRVGHLHGVAAPLPDGAVSFDPIAPRLESGAEQAVRLAVDLGEYRDGADAFEFGVDVLGGDRVFSKLWVRIQVR
jgi:hypothetical protein